MPDPDVMAISRAVLGTALLVSAPILLLITSLGLAISVAQALTQVQEQSLSFVPKLLGTATIIFTLGPWMIGRLVDLFRHYLSFQTGAFL